MDTNKILSANILDLIFDDRNKEYGAYELRKTYTKRIKRALFITAFIALLIFSGAILASSLKPDKETGFKITTVDISIIPDDEKKPEPLPEKKKPEPKTRTEKYVDIKIVEDNKADKPLPTQEDLEDSKIADFTQEGIGDKGLVSVEEIDGNTGIIEPPKKQEPEIYYDVQIPAKYDGNWQKFLTRNLNGNVPVDNNAPSGRYTVLIQFVVDKEGNISDIIALTNHGYGLEDEAIRVLRKAKGWKPGIQNGHEVKSYHRQPITFEVMEE
jgi:protein TonB